MPPTIKNPQHWRAALYIRLSKEDESDGPSASVTNQQSLLREFAEQNALAVHDTYIDDGWSGTDFDRPNFRRMLTDIEAGRVNMVITKDLSRLGRDYILTGHYMERYFPEHAVRYISLLDGVDTGVESSANDITPFRAIMNDMYAKDISKKIKSVKHDKQRKGEFIGGKPVFGYRKHPTEKNKIVIDENAAPIVRRVFGLALQGISCRQIAVQLNAEHIPTPAVYAGLTPRHQGVYSGKWSSERIADMLKNETYIGNMVQGRSRKISYKSKKCVRQAPEAWLIVENTHEAIIDKETFAKVNRLLASRRHTRSRTYDFPLKGLIFCRECGYPLAVINRKNAAGEDVLYLICRTYQRFGRAGACTAHTVKEKTVSDAVIAKVSEVCRAYSDLAELQNLAEATLNEALNATKQAAEGQALNRRIDNLSANIDKMYLDKLNGLLADEDFRRLYSKLQQERTALSKQQQNISRQRQAPLDTAAYAKRLVQEFLKSALGNRELLCELIERVELTQEKQIIIKFRFNPPPEA